MLSIVLSMVLSFDLLNIQSSYLLCFQLQLFQGKAHTFPSWLDRRLRGYPSPHTDARDQMLRVVPSDVMRTGLSPIIEKTQEYLKYIIRYADFRLA